ncbi:MAG: hypothetical protein ACFB8W_16990 [Elainellaceae cyanobacterium]
MTFADVQQMVASGHTQVWAGSALLTEVEGFAGMLTESDFVTGIS